MLLLKMSQGLQHSETWQSRVISIQENLFRPLECSKSTCSRGCHLGTLIRGSRELVGQGSTY